MAAVLLWAGLLLPLPVRAQQHQGPITPPPVAPPPTLPLPASQPAQTRPASKTPNPSSASFPTYPIIHQPPSAPVDQIIQEVATHEADFKVSFGAYTYQRTYLVETVGDDGNPDGQYQMTEDITYSSSGQRYVKVTDAPVPTLTRISISEQDLEDLRQIQPFVLTTTDLPKYNVTYVGQQRVDYLHTYVFDVAPKKIEKNQRYFQGRIWVDVHDLAIVKTDGKAVPNIVKHNYEDLFPRFTTYCQNIDGQYWFPTYTYADDTLHFGITEGGDVHIKMFIWWSNYKRFRVSYKIVGPAQPHR